LKVAMKRAKRSGGKSNARREKKTQRKVPQRDKVDEQAVVTVKSGEKVGGGGEKNSEGMLGHWGHAPKRKQNSFGLRGDSLGGRNNGYGGGKCLFGVMRARLAEGRKLRTRKRRKIKKGNIPRRGRCGCERKLSQKERPGIQPGKMGRQQTTLYTRPDGEDGRLC